MSGVEQWASVNSVYLFKSINWSCLFLPVVHKKFHSPYFSKYCSRKFTVSECVVTSTTSHPRYFFESLHIIFHINNIQYSTLFQMQIN